MTDITIRPARADEAATLAAIEAAGFPPAAGFALRGREILRLFLL